MIELFTNLMNGLQIRTKLNQMLLYLNPFIRGDPSVTNSTNNNTFWGQNSGANNNVSGINLEGTGNTFFGKDVGQANEIGYGNTAIGNSALKNSKQGESNTTIGKNSQLENKYGNRNSSLGSGSMKFHKAGNYNTVGGYEALWQDIFGTRNTLFGYKSGQQAYYLRDNACFGYKTGQLLDSGGDALINFTDNGDGTINVYSNILPAPNDEIRIVGTSLPLDHEYSDNYDGVYTVLSIGVDYFVITSSFYEISTLITLGRWLEFAAAELNTLLGYVAGYNITKGSRNTCLGYAVTIIDVESNDQLNICDIIYSDIVNKCTGFGGKFIPEATIHNKGDYIQESLSSDPSDPADGSSVQWISDGTESGDVGDVMMKITVGVTTKTITLIDFSAE